VRDQVWSRLMSGKWRRIRGVEVEAVDWTRRYERRETEVATAAYKSVSMLANLLEDREEC
jgi:hypothetical protein